jgi:hypothetical protein
VRLPVTLKCTRSEAGAALLIAIFALMLVSVVAIALVVSTGTDSSLAGNYRTASGAYYAALGGLEEARGRLSWKNTDFINNTASGLFSSSALPAWSLTSVVYITNPNPATGEVVNPTSSNPADYPDTEYGQEFAFGLGGAFVQQIASDSSAASSVPVPNYKWVRINPVTEQALGLDVNGDGVLDSASVLFYDPANLNGSYSPAPGLILSSPGSPPAPPTTTSVEALEITALAALPNGSRRLLQYIVAPMVVSPLYSQPSPGPSPQALNFPAALTLLGNGVSFTGPGNANFFINGQDECQSSNLVYSIGYSNSADGGNISPHATPPSNYMGYPPGAGGPPAPPSTGPTTIANISPSVSNSLVNSNWLNPSTLDAISQQITQSADVVINGNTTGSGIVALAPAMSASNPMTIVVNGDLDLNAWHNTGYGLLLVTGTLKYDPDATWDGLVLIIGQGAFVSTKGGVGEIDGAMVIAKTRDSSGNLLSSLGASSFSQTGGANSGKGIYYNSCWVNRALGPGYVPDNSAYGAGPQAYRVLSFHELPLS